MKVECSYLGLYVQIEFGIVPFDSDLGGRTVGCRNKVQSLFVATDGLVHKRSSNYIFLILTIKVRI